MGLSLLLLEQDYQQAPPPAPESYPDQSYGEQQPYGYSQPPPEDYNNTTVINNEDGDQTIIQQSKCREE